MTGALCRHQVTLGERRWRGILRDIEGMARLKVYMAAHDGALPPALQAQGFVNKLRALVGAREDPNIRYRILLSKQRWRDRGIEEKKAYVMAAMLRPPYFISSGIAHFASRTLATFLPHAAHRFILADKASIQYANAPPAPTSQSPCWLPVQ